SLENWCSQLSNELRNTRAQVNYLSQYVVHLREKINSLVSCVCSRTSEKKIESQPRLPIVQNPVFDPSQSVFPQVYNPISQPYFPQPPVAVCSPEVNFGRRSFGTQHPGSEVRSASSESDSSDKENSTVNMTPSPLVQSNSSPEEVRTKQNPTLRVPQTSGRSNS
ncbi:hypothetical protein FBUS_10497, partial [Fasciolopsis buskii]